MWFCIPKSSSCSESLDILFRLDISLHFDGTSYSRPSFLMCSDTSASLNGNGKIPWEKLARVVMRSENTGARFNYWSWYKILAERFRWRGREKVGDFSWSDRLKIHDWNTDKRYVLEWIWGIEGGYFGLDGMFEIVNFLSEEFWKSSAKFCIFIHCPCFVICKSFLATPTSDRCLDTVWVVSSGPSGETRLSAWLTNDMNSNKRCSLTLGHFASRHLPGGNTRV